MHLRRPCAARLCALDSMRGGHLLGCRRVFVHRYAPANLSDLVGS